VNEAFTKANSATFDYTGQIDYLDIFDALDKAFVDLTVKAGARASQRQVDLSARAAYGLLGANPKTPHEKAVEYFLWDWEYSQSPEVRTHRELIDPRLIRLSVILVDCRVMGTVYH